MTDAHRDPVTEVLPVAGRAAAEAEQSALATPQAPGKGSPDVPTSAAPSTPAPAAEPAPTLVEPQLGYTPPVPAGDAYPGYAETGFGGTGTGFGAAAAATSPVADAQLEADPRYAYAAPAAIPGYGDAGFSGAYQAAAAAAYPEAPRAPLAMLEARGITAWFGDHQVLDRVSLTMPAGQITSLIGPSGCGKSTFLRILNRMHELVPSASLAGEVLLDGDDIYEPEKRLTDARKAIGMVFQKPNPFPAMSIYDNVIAGLKLTGIRADRARKDYLVETSLQKAGLWKEVRDRLRAPGGGLSGGQQQRLCIARSLAVQPRVLLMDEPCSALDPTSTRVIEETMLDLASEVTIVIVTHNMQQAQRVSSQCAFFLAGAGRPGGIVEHGPTDAMFGDPQDDRTADYVNGRFG